MPDTHPAPARDFLRVMEIADGHRVDSRATAMLLTNHIRHLEIDHLLAQVHAEFSTLTSTPVERELLRRVDDLVDQAERDRPMMEAIEDVGSFEPDEVGKLLSAAAPLGNMDSAAGYLRAIVDSDFSAGEQDELVLILEVLREADIATAADLKKQLTKGK